MKYLIDTDWVVEVLKGKRDVISQVISYTSEGIAISLIAYGEVYDGIIHGLHRERHEQGFLKFLETVEVLSLNSAIMQEFAYLRGNLRAQGMLIGDLDMLIAATALHHNLILLSPLDSPEYPLYNARLCCTSTALHIYRANQKGLVL